jgi:hypothetical protein
MTGESSLAARGRKLRVKGAHVLTGLAVLVALLASAQPSPQVGELSVTAPEKTSQAGNLRSYHATATYTHGGARVVVVLDPSVQAPNGLVITDAIVNAEGGPFWYMVEISENGTTKASFGEAVSPNWNCMAGSPSLSLRSGIPIQKNASLEISVIGGTYLPTVPQTVHCTISGYVW